jgi:hypothetical protein
MASGTVGGGACRVWPRGNGRFGIAVWNLPGIQFAFTPVTPPAKSHPVIVPAMFRAEPRSFPGKFYKRFGNSRQAGVTALRRYLR